ncbi:TetR/AcrR family transcriptional regulator [Hwanghaeella grinnelliae]|nr:TetR/AcrR family transcriptional regulator [Hwanghaeella grinnelliae]
MMNIVRGRPRSEASTQAVLAAAERLFGTNGYSRTSIEAIAKAAGVGKQTVYRWWPTKSHLAAAIYEQLAPSSKIAPNTGALQSDIAAMLRSLFTAYTSGPAAALLSGLIVEAQGSDESVMDFRAVFFDERRIITTDLFDRARNRGEIPLSADIDLLSDMLIGAIWMRLLAGHAPLDGAFAEGLAANLVAAASAEPTQTPRTPDLEAS